MRTVTVLACASLALAWVVLPLCGGPPFSSHMLAHMLLVAVAAPLLAVALRGRFDVVTTLGAACSPLIASFFEFVLVWGWHAPALHHAARMHGGWFALEQLTFLGAGLWLWLCVLGGTPAQRRARAPASVAALLLTSVHMTMLGAIVLLAPRPLYAHGPSSWLSPLHDQQLGGGLMVVVGGWAYLAGGVSLAWLLLRRPARGGGAS